jgi:hypothetical protein
MGTRLFPQDSERQGARSIGLQLYIQISKKAVFLLQPVIQPVWAVRALNLPLWIPGVSRRIMGLND